MIKLFLIEALLTSGAFKSREKRQRWYVIASPKAVNA